MNIKHLRIGNLIYQNNKVVQLVSIHSDDTIRIIDNNIEKGCYKLNNNFAPIPLTSEWLLNFGFENKYGSYVLSTPRGTISIEEDLAEISSVITHNGFKAPCGYIHQLQNLYFVLTGSELTIA